MPSPFPGMNPYLEQAALWPDFHGAYVYRLRELLAPLVEPGYLVRVEDHVYIHELPADSYRPLGRPDVSVIPGQPPAGASTATIDAPFAVEIRDVIDEVRVRLLEVVDRRGRQVVTVLELLSPSNKYAGPDRDQYLAKRRELLRAGVNYVEIDLLRGGPRTLPDLPPCDYNALVARAADRPRAGVWPVRLRDRLPIIPVPLRPGDTEPKIDLQDALHTVYDRNRFGNLVYDAGPEPALAPEDAAWAAGLVPRPGG